MHTCVHVCSQSVCISISNELMAVIITKESNVIIVVNYLLYDPLHISYHLGINNV